MGAYPHDDVELTLELDGGGSLTGNVATRRIERGSDTREVVRMIIEVRAEGEPFNHFPDFLPRYAGGLTPTEPQQTSKPPAPEPPAPSAPARGAIAVARPDLVASAEARARALEHVIRAREELEAYTDWTGIERGVVYEVALPGLELVRRALELDEELVAQWATARDDGQSGTDLIDLAFRLLGYGSAVE